MMKKLTIGRNNACDIVIPDTSDLVSRKQAVLTYSFWGKMILYDTSNNGTFVNGQRLENGKGMKVTRKDKVNFAKIVDLDWNEVKDPYSKVKTISVVCVFVVIIVISILLALFFLPYHQGETVVSDLETVETGVKEEKGETFTTIQSQVVESKTQKAPQKKSKRKKINKTKSITPNDVVNKEVNDYSPIMY